MTQNLSYKLVEQLAVQFPNSIHVRNVGLATAPDAAVWLHPKSNGLMIVSKDTDFQQRALLYGHPPKVIWIRLGNCSTSSISESLQLRVADIAAFEADPTASFLALS